MGQVVPTQHPAVVLRSHFNQLRALLVAALLALIGLTVTVVILATDEEPAGNSSSAQPIGHINYGGFNPATGRPQSAPLPQEHPLPSRLGEPRYDGGPEEGTADIARSDTIRVNPSTGYPMTGHEGDAADATGGSVKDYSMNSATGEFSKRPAPSPGTRYDGGPEEGGWGSAVRPR